MNALATKPASDVGADRPHILVVDDDRRIRTLLSRFLGSEGYFVSSAADAAEATARLSDLRFDLIVLDVMMPGESGKEFAARLRRQDETPILMLSALAEAKDRVEGLEAGVDDYLAKPFEPRELSLRIASILRRAGPSSSGSAKRVRFGDFLFDMKRGELQERGRLVHLTTREREMLQILARNAGEAVPRRALARRAGAPCESASERSVDVEITRLRRKIEDCAGNPRYLQTVRGRGYRLLVDHLDEHENGSSR